MPDQVGFADKPNESNVFQSTSRLVEILYCYYLFNLKLNVTNHFPKEKNAKFLSYSEDLHVQ